MLGFFNFLIRWSFYLLFLLVPLFFTGNTSELFEFNKMWITFGLTLIIAGAWISKMVLERQIKIKKTLLDIPILLFLLSQVISTIFSLDFHTSLWGYYSRFNGGLYSLLSYALLYFAFTSNIAKRDLLKNLYVILAGAIGVALWGLPSHFGYDPTCYMFRGTFDVSCWTAAFQPKVRIFSTLGQPDWLAAYLVYLIPLATSLGLIFWKAKRKAVAYSFFAMLLLFYLDLLFTRARSGFIGFAVSMGIFVLFYIALYWRSFAKHALLKALKSNVSFLIVLAVIVVATFFVGTPISQLDSFSLTGVQSFLTEKHVTPEVPTPKTASPAPLIPIQELGGTDSGKIRLLVWEGAWQIFLHNPIIGTGVETFAYSYYQYRPAAHNLTSEWDYLYNKAHNEYLNYLATTGILGFGTYMALVGLSLYIMLRAFLQTKIMSQEDKNLPLFSTSYAKKFLSLAFLTGYISILVTNFFGFSVVIINILLFLTPAFVLFTTDEAEESWYLFPAKTTGEKHVNEVAWVGIGIAWLLILYFLIVLLRFWLADTSYALGSNLDHASQYQAAYTSLHDAVATRPSEPTFQDEMSINDAVLATALIQQKDATNGAHLRDEAIAVSDLLVQSHPRIVTYWKSRVRIFYTLAQVDPKYLAVALNAIENAAILAPTDAKISYNLGLLYGQTGDMDKAIATLQNTVKLKPDYKDAYYALGLFYRQKAVGNGKTVIDSAAEQKAVETMHFILDNFGQDPKITEILTTWGEK